MSEVAGRLSIEAAAVALRRPTGGRGVLMGGVPGVKPAKVVVLGGGVVGTHAARMAAGLGADVSMIDKSLPRLRQLDELFHGRVRTLVSTMETIETEVLSADVVIGAVLVAGASAPKLVTRAMLKTHEEGRGSRRCFHRSGRLFRDFQADDARASDFRSRRHHSLLRREYARRSSCHVGASLK